MVDFPGPPGNLRLAMWRTVAPELLDSLAPDDPAALHNRRDLRLVNVLMGNHRWIARELARRVQPGERVLEIGAGTGELLGRLSRGGVFADGLDRWPAPAGWPASRRWHRGDLLRFAGYAAYPVIVGNLIFHQFTDRELGELGTRLRPTTRLLLACEPRRSRFSQVLYRLVAHLSGAHEVSRHDAHVSIAAGFSGDELAHALGLVPDDWIVAYSETVTGASRLVATRRR